MATLRQQVAAHLREWMQTTPALDTQEKLAKAAGLAQSSVGRVLRGKIGCTIDTLEVIAAAFGRPARDLLDGQSQQQRAGSAISFDLSGLPVGEQQKIASFVEFTLGQYAANHPESITSIHKTMPPPELVAPLARAAKREPRGTAFNEHRRIQPRRKRRGAAV